MKNSKKLLSFLNGEGFALKSSPRNIESRLKKLLGEERYEDYLDTGDAMRMGEASIRELYRCMETAKEAHLLFSHQGEIFSEVCAWLTVQLEKAEPGKGSRIAEMGSASGIFCGWLTELFPEAEIVGFEREPNFLSMAEGSYGDASFCEWDYSAKPLGDDAEAFNFVVSGLGIDFHHCNEHYSLGATSFRGTAPYEALRAQSLPILRNWRNVCSAGARLFTVLRIPGPLEFVALIDAASASGWALDLSEADWVKVGSKSHSKDDRERLPALTFVASEPVESTGLPEEKRLIGHWINEELNGAFRKPLEGSLARELFSSLAGGKVLSSEKETYDDGHVMQKILKDFGSFQIAYQQATTGFADLRILGSNSSQNNADK